MRAVNDRKCALCRRVQKKLYLKGERCFSEKCALTKRNYAPGQHGSNQRKGFRSEFGRQLAEKQKLRNMYGLKEKQLVRYVKGARSQEGVTSSILWSILERRLDNVVYRIGWASSHGQARQMVSHGLVRVNDRKVDVPSYQVSEGDQIVLKDRFVKNQDIVSMIKKNLKDREVPAWLRLSLKKESEAKVAKNPELTRDAQDVDMVLALEYYSRR